MHFFIVFPIVFLCFGLVFSFLQLDFRVCVSLGCFSWQWRDCKKSLESQYKVIRKSLEIEKDTKIHLVLALRADLPATENLQNIRKLAKKTVCWLFLNVFLKFVEWFWMRLKVFWISFECSWRFLNVYWLIVDSCLNVFSMCFEGVVKFVWFWRLRRW